MAEQIIIDKAVIDEFHDLGKNMDAGRIDTHVLRAQQIDLEPLLGKLLYTVFIEDATAIGTFATPKFQELYDGKVYTNTSFSGEIYFRGIKPLLSAYSYARIVTNNSTHATRGGMVQKLTDFSEEKTQGQQNQKSRDAVSQAIALQESLELFLDQNRNLYPEWNKRRGRVQRTAFKFNRVGAPIMGTNFRVEGRPFRSGENNHDHHH